MNNNSSFLTVSQLSEQLSELFSAPIFSNIVVLGEVTTKVMRKGTVYSNLSDVDENGKVKASISVVVFSSVLNYSLTYTGITSLGFPFLILTTGGTNLVRADGSPKFSMTCTLTGAIINTILDPTLIFGFHMDVAGVGAASALSQYVSAPLSLIVCCA